jgi:hypothetical protein
MPVTNSINCISNPAGILSQYTEGTWTPIIIGSTTAGTGTYTLQSGNYTRIGNLVFLSGRVTWTAHTGTGNMLLGTLPFTSRNISNYISDAVINTANVTTPAGVISVIGEIPANSTRVSILASRNNNTNLSFAMDATGTIDITGFYEV